MSDNKLDLFIADWQSSEIPEESYPLETLFNFKVVDIIPLIILISNEYLNHLNTVFSKRTLIVGVNFKTVKIEDIDFIPKENHL